ncbi:MAG: HPr family phosphocarrier protein [Verrucomicrobia bacterium]|nr:HPr family phosphocarrier protein [Verrucomicrobiota bacterium]MCH8512152.1 HPr family phosphocarrier protein [Kiritimatiellia bacterium]
MSTSDPITKEFTIGNEYGMHARPAALFVKCASQFEAEIQVIKDGIEVSGKSIMGLLTLEGHQGSVITLQIQGPDAEEAMSSLSELIEAKFGE